MRAAVAIAIGLSILASPLRAATQLSAVVEQGPGTIVGNASNAAGQVLPNVTVQARDLATGRITSTVTTDAKGAFRFVNVRAGDYLIEIVNESGRVVGTALVSVAPGAVVTGVAVAATAAGTAAGGAAVGLSTAAVVITAAGVAAGVFAVVAVKSAASPSR